MNLLFIYAINTQKFLLFYVHLTIHQKHIEKIAASLNSKILLDFTYSWFQDDFSICQIKTYLRYPNILQLYSLSKSFGAAGLRIGFAVVEANLKKEITSAWNLFPLNHASYSFLKKLLQDRWWEYALKRVRQIKDNKRELIHFLQHIEEINIFPSGANFITVKVKKDYEAFNLMLKQHRINIKPLSQDTLRITIGTKNECLRIGLLIEAFFRNKPSDSSRY